MPVQRHDHGMTNNGMSIFGIDYQHVIKSPILLGAVSLDAHNQRR